MNAVATMDTVSLVHGGSRGLLCVLPAQLAEVARAALRRCGVTTTSSLASPPATWDDPAVRAALMDGLVRDGYRAVDALRTLRSGQLSPDAAQEPTCWPP